MVRRAPTLPDVVLVALNLTVCVWRPQEAGVEGKEVGTLESVKVKVLLNGSDSAPQSLRIELSSEADLFFHYMHVMDEVRRLFIALAP